MEIQLETLTEALAIGQLSLVMEVLVTIGQAVIAGEVVIVNSKETALPTRLDDFQAYQNWLNAHFFQVLRA